MSKMYAEICDWDNLQLAWRKASRGKRGRRAAAAFEYNLAELARKSPNTVGLLPFSEGVSLTGSRPIASLRLQPCRAENRPTWLGSYPFWRGFNQGREGKRWTND